MPSFLIHREFVSLVNICWIQEVLESYYAQGTLIIYLRLSLLPVFPPSLHLTEEKVLLFLFYMFSQFCPFQTLSERALAIISSFVYYQSPPFYWLLLCWGRRQENKHPQNTHRSALIQVRLFLRKPQTYPSSGPTSTKSMKRQGVWAMIRIIHIGWSCTPFLSPYWTVGSEQAGCLQVKVVTTSF